MGQSNYEDREGNFLQRIPGMAREGLSTAWGWIGDGIDAAIPAIGNFMNQTILPHLPKPVQSILTSAGAAVSGLFQTGHNVIGQVADAGADTVGNIGNSLQENIAPRISEVLSGRDHNVSMNDVSSPNVPDNRTPSNDRQMM